jgi:hypothetical protein
MAARVSDTAIEPKCGFVIFLLLPSPPALSI